MEQRLDKSRSADRKQVFVCTRLIGIFSNESIDLVTLREFFAGQSGIAERCEGEGEAMMPSRVLRVTGEQMKRYFDQSKETTEMAKSITF